MDDYLFILDRNLLVLFVFLIEIVVRILSCGIVVVGILKEGVINKGDVVEIFGFGVFM